MLKTELEVGEWFGFGTTINARVAGLRECSPGHFRVQLQVLAPQSVRFYRQGRDKDRRWPIELGDEPTNGMTRPKYAPQPARR